MSPNVATISSSSSAIRQDSQYIGNSSNGDATKINYEVFLPIVFALAFMLMLLLVYICNNVDVRGLEQLHFYKIQKGTNRFSTRPLVQNLLVSAKKCSLNFSKIQLKNIFEKYLNFF